MPLPERDDRVPSGAPGESPRGRLNVALVSPEIPPNTGNIGRLCLATGAVLHLVHPLGFDLDDRALRRAGLDYWPEVDVRHWENRQAYRAAPIAGRRYLLTTKAGKPYWEARFQPGDHLVFGCETKGLPESWLKEEPENCLTIPMVGARSLNLATAVGIVLYEAVRQQAIAKRSPDAVGVPVLP
jgi:tRNA (cytidine/uridine-2'-O-)-methyltransferase